MTFKATALISIAIVLGLSTVQGSLALWSQTVTSEKQLVQSADFEVTVSHNGKSQRLPSSGTLTLDAITGLKPGSTLTTPIAITNSTDAGGEFDVKATASAPIVTGQLSAHLNASVSAGREDSCVTMQGKSLNLNKGDTGTYCLTLTLDENTPVTLSGTEAHVSFMISTEQQTR